MAAYVQRCKSVNALINAITDEQYEEAMKEAIAVDRLIDSGVKSEAVLAAEKPLLGVPFTCKEAIGVKGNKIIKLFFSPFFLCSFTCCTILIRILCF